MKLSTRSEHIKISSIILPHFKQIYSTAFSRYNIHNERKEWTKSFSHAVCYKVLKNKIASEFGKESFLGRSWNFQHPEEFFFY